jgi:hypothetical protein
MRDEDFFATSSSKIFNEMVWPIVHLVVVIESVIILFNIVLMKSHSYSQRQAGSKMFLPFVKQPYDALLYHFN